MPEPTRLVGKTALVTGVASQGAGVGTGKAIGITFALKGGGVLEVGSLTTDGFIRATEGR